MPDSTIGWTDKSDNAASGCSEARLADGSMSEECLNCYARLQSARMPGLMRGGPPSARKEAKAALYDGVAARTSRGAKWTGVLRWDRAMLAEAFERMAPGKITFLGSMTDPWHPGHDPGLLVALAEEIRAMASRNRPWPRGLVTLTKRAPRLLEWQREHFPGGLPPFCWPGVTAGYQASADERIEHLIGVKARVLVVSVEPMLGPLNLQRVPWGVNPDTGEAGEMGCSYDALQGRAYVGRGMTVGRGRKIGWVIAGCESGRHRRPTETAWIRDLRDQCDRSGTPFFLKQLVRDFGAGIHEADLAADQGKDGDVIPEPMLDGRQWVDFPA